MRVYNAKKAQIDFPLAGDTRVTVPGFSVSRDLLPNEQFLTMICQSFEPDEIALIVSGPFEVGLCGKNPTVTPFIVNSLDEAIKRFNAPAQGKSTPKPEPAPAIEVVEEKVEEPAEEVVIEPEAEQNPIPEAVEEVLTEGAEPETSFPEPEAEEEIAEQAEVSDDAMDAVSDVAEEDNGAPVNNFGGKKSKKKKRK